MKKISILAIFSVILVVFSCTRDEAPEISCEGVASWDTNIKEIIQTNCVYSECHDGSAGVPGIYFDYSGIEPWLVDGDFENRVVGLGDMPPSYADGATELNQEDLDLILCWIEEGYPEN